MVVKHVKHVNVVLTKNYKILTFFLNQVDKDTTDYMRDIHIINYPITIKHQTNSLALLPNLAKQTLMQSKKIMNIKYVEVLFQWLKI